MAQKQKIYIPTYISSVNYAPARILPRLFFYNGTKDCEKYYIMNESNASRALEVFPYFDNYSGNTPTSSSLSLLFYNEEAVYGTTPSQSLYTTYWENYVELLYNPRTRVVNASAIIPLADYFQMELNDIVEFRGNYYHLRAINDYNLKNGECSLQLLGPILPDALPFVAPPVPTTTTTTTTSTTSTSTTSTTSTSTTTSTTTTTAGGTANLAWTYSVTGGPTSNGMGIRVNGSIVESRNNTSSGTWTGLVPGDTIYVVVACNGCTGGSNKANAWCTGIITDASCATTSTTLTSYTYTVTSGDIGNTLHLDSFASCEGGCL